MSKIEPFAAAKYTTDMEVGNQRQGPKGQGSDQRDETLLNDLQQDRQGAAAALFDRYQKDVNRLVGRVLGPDSEHDDVVQQAFVAILKALPRLRDPGAIRSWVVSITVNTARGQLRRRRLQRLVQFTEPENVPEIPHEDDHSGRQDVAEVYKLLNKLPSDERIAFILRYVDAMSLEAVAAAADCSLATIKRRLKRAEERFVKLVARNPALAQRLQTGARWGQP